LNVRTANYADVLAILVAHNNAIEASFRRKSLFHSEMAKKIENQR